MTVTCVVLVLMRCRRIVSSLLVHPDFQQIFISKFHSSRLPRLKELQRKQQIEDAKENLVNGDAADSKDIPSVRVNDRVAVSVAPSTNAVPSLSTPSSPRSASPLVNGEAIGRGAGSRDPTSAPHLLEPRANSLPRNVKGLNNRRESGGGDGGSSADEEARSVSLAQYR